MFDASLQEFSFIVMVTICYMLQGTRIHLFCLITFHLSQILDVEGQVVGISLIK